MNAHCDIFNLFPLFRNCDVSLYQSTWHAGTLQATAKKVIYDILVCENGHAMVPNNNVKKGVIACRSINRMTMHSSR